MLQNLGGISINNRFTVGDSDTLHPLLDIHQTCHLFSSFLVSPPKKKAHNGDQKTSVIHKTSVGAKLCQGTRTPPCAPFGKPSLKA